MTSKEVVLKLMKEQNMTNADLASVLKISPAALWDRLKSPKNNSLTVKKLNEMLCALNYEVVVMPRAKSSNINNAYVINDEGLK